jgi:hypothetical protein
LPLPYRCLLLLLLLPAAAPVAAALGLTRPLALSAAARQALALQLSPAMQRIKRGSSGELTLYIMETCIHPVQGCVLMLHACTLIKSKTKICVLNVCQPQQEH